MGRLTAVFIRNSRVWSRERRKFDLIGLTTDFSYEPTKKMKVRDRHTKKARENDVLGAIVERKENSRSAGRGSVRGHLSRGLA